jgi:hypothetical protein
MYSKGKLLQMITSEKASTRYDACEWLRISPESSPAIVYALQNATHDLDPEVAERAKLAMQADVHHQMAIQMGLIPPDPVASAPEFIEESAGIEQLPEVTVPPAIPAMYKEIRSWAWWSIGLGVVHLFSSGFFSADWGVILIIVGATSFLFKSSAMFVVYGVTLAWAAVSNISSQQPGWIFFALFQFYLVVRIFMDFRRYHKAEKDYIASQAVSTDVRVHADRAGNSFPWIGPVLGCSSIIGFTLWFFGTILLAMVNNNFSQYENFTYFLGGLLGNLGVLAFAVGLASVLMGYRPKAAGIIAIVTGAILLVIQIIFLFI